MSQSLEVIPKTSNALLVALDSEPNPICQRRLVFVSETDGTCLVHRRRDVDF